MFAAIATLTVFAVVLALTVQLVRQDGAKILAALEGRSYAAQPTSSRPVTIRFSQAERVAVRLPAPAGMRAAA